MSQSAVTEANPGTSAIAKSSLLRVILVLPGATDLDTQGRIKGSLDVPLNSLGSEQAQQSANELRPESMDAIYCSPGLAARQTARMIAGEHARVRVQDDLRNLNRGLWHGKLVAELRDSQPRVYRQWKEQPESVHPPDGETVDDARKRIGRVVNKIIRKHKHGTVAMVVSEPAASVLRQQLSRSQSMGNLWEAECQCGRWEAIEVVTTPDQ